MPSLKKIMLENGDSQKQGKSKLLLIQALLKVVPIFFKITLSTFSHPQGLPTKIVYSF